MQAPTVDDLVRLYVDVCNAQSPTRTESERSIMDLVGANAPGMLELSAQIIHTDGLPMEAVFQAIVTIRRCFTPCGTTTIKVLERGWMGQDSGKRDMVKSAVMRGIMFPHESIVNMASYVLALMLRVEKNQMISVIDALCSIVRGDEYSMLTKAGAINAIAEMCANSMDDIEGCDEWIAKIYQNLREWMPITERDETVPELRITLFKAAANVLRFQKELFQADGESLARFVGPALNILSSGTPHLPLVREVCKYCFTVTKELYEWEHFDFGPIGMKMCELVGIPNPEVACLAVEFWNDLIKEEIKRKNTKDLGKKYEELWEKCQENKPDSEKSAIRESEKIRYSTVYRDLSATAAPILVHRLFDMFLQMDDGDRAEEVRGVSQPHRHAFVLLQKWYRVYPQNVFDIVASLWRGAIEKGDISQMPWVHLHGLFLSLAVILDEKRTDKTVYDFMNMSIPPMNVPMLRFIIEYIKSDVPRMVDTTLYIISLAIKSYGFYVSDQEACMLLIEYMATLIQMHPPPSIIVRIFMVLQAMISSRSMSAPFFSTFFNSIMKFPEFVTTSRPDIFETDLLTLSYHIVNLLIKESPDALCDQIGGLLMGTMRELNEMASGELSDQQFMIQRVKLEVITNCYHRFGPRYSAVAKDVCQLLFTLLRRVNSAIWKEALIALILVLRSLDEQSVTEVYNGELLHHLIGTAMASQNSEIIGHTMIALGAFYQKMITQSLTPAGQDLVARLPATFELITGVINGEEYSPDFKPKALVALADITEAAHKHIPMPIREQLLKLYLDETDKLSTDPKLMKNEDYVNHMNLMFVGIFRGLTSILSLIEDGPDPYKDRRVMRLILTGPARKYTSLPTYTRSSTEKFCQLLTKWNEVYGVSGNIIVNRRVHVVSLVYGAARAYIDGDRKFGDHCMNLIKTMGNW